MKNLKVVALSAAMVASVVAAGCTSQSTTEHYVSPRIQGEAKQINLEAVQKAFWETKGTDFKGWMAAFEKSVNEIYEGKEVVSIDATKKDGKLVVTGYIDKVQKEGFQPGDEKLFSIEQTGDAVDKQMPYRVADSNDRTYYEGHHSILDNPILQVMILSHLMNGWGGGYYTPAPHVVVLQQSRDAFRASPQYSQVQTANSGFFSRFKTNSTGGLTSSTKFGGSSSLGSSPLGSSSSPPPRRSLFGSSPTFSSGSSSTSVWGGRRSSSFGSSFGSSRGWGGRRR